MELMQKVRQVSESYELNKLKTQNRTIELDARLATERLFATKVRLRQMENENEKLAKQMRLNQQQARELEKRLLLTGTMLRQFVDNASTASTSTSAQAKLLLAGGGGGGLDEALGKQPPKLPAANGGSTARRKPPVSPVVRQRSGGSRLKAAGGRQPWHRAGGEEAEADQQVAGSGGAAAAPAQLQSSSGANTPAPATGKTTADSTAQTSAAATQTSQPSRARTIINDLRQRLNLGSSSSAAVARRNRPVGLGQTVGKGLMGAARVAAANAALSMTRHQQPGTDSAIQAQAELDRQASSDGDDDLLLELASSELNSPGELELSRMVAAARPGRPKHGRHHGRPLHKSSRQRERPNRKRSISLDNFLNNSLVREIAGEQVIISRGWPAARRQRAASSQRHDRGRRRHHSSESLARRRPIGGRRDKAESHQEAPRGMVVAHSAHHRRQVTNGNLKQPSKGTIDELQKRQLLIEYLKHSKSSPVGGGGAPANTKATLKPPPAEGRGVTTGNQRRRPSIIVHYELPVHSSGQPIELAEGATK